MHMPNRNNGTGRTRKGPMAEKTGLVPAKNDHVLSETVWYKQRASIIVLIGGNRDHGWKAQGCCRATGRKPRDETGPASWSTCRGDAVMETHWEKNTRCHPCLSRFYKSALVRALWLERNWVRLSARATALCYSWWTTAIPEAKLNLSLTEPFWWPNLIRSCGRNIMQASKVLLEWDRLWKIMPNICF